MPKSKESTYFEVACIDENGTPTSFDIGRPESLEDARAIIAKKRQPRGNPDYDNYWPKQRYAIRRVTTYVDTLEISEP